MSEQNIHDRLQYARRFECMHVEFWANVWFTDEYSIELGKTRPRQWVWRYSGEQWLPQNMAFRFENKDTLMIWAAMRADGTIYLCLVNDYYNTERIMKAVTYRRLLEDILPQIYLPGHVWVQDNARKHTAGIIQQLIEEYDV